MNKLTFKNNQWLKNNDLKQGCFYIAKDGRVLLYLGKSKEELYVFYTCCSVIISVEKDTSSLGYSDVLTLANYDIIVPYVINVCKDTLNRHLYKDSLLELKNTPKLYCSFPFVSFINEYKNWYDTSNIFYNNTLPILCLGNKSTNIFVSAKDLIPGHLYYSGGCWRSTYVYLGRTSDKQFVWSFIGNEHTLMAESLLEILQNAYCTNSNKKVRPLKDALNDKKAHVSEGTEMLIRNNFSVDVSNLTQRMLDSRSHCCYC